MVNHNGYSSTRCRMAFLILMVNLIGPKDGSQLEEVTALVDTGSIYTMLPSTFLAGIGVVPEWESDFELADGSEVKLHLAEVLVQINGERRTQVCIFGPEDSQPLLGAFTLEGFGLMADPVNRRLVPARLFLA